MIQVKPARPRASIHTWIAVIVNTLVGGVVGAAFGSFGGLLPWLAGGLALGAMIGLANEALFNTARPLARWYKLRTVILVLIETLFIIYLIIPAYGAYHMTHPFRVPVGEAPMNSSLAYEEAAFTTADGVTLRGWYVPSRNRAAIIAIHGSDANRLQLLRHAQALAERGYGVLLFDLRAHGESDGEVFQVANPSADVKAAVNYLRRREDVDPDQIGAVGLSLGAQALLQAAAEEPALKAIVSDGAAYTTEEDILPLPAQYRLLYVATPMYWMTDRMAELMSGVPAKSLKRSLRQMGPRPILFISTGQAEEQFMNRRLCALAGPAAELWELPDTAHIGGIFTHPDEYKQRMLAFLDTFVPARTPASH